MYLYNISQVLLWNYAGVAPVIDHGSFALRPDPVPTTNITVKIGTPAYIVDGYNLTIVCNIINGTLPITISWYHNGVLDSSRAGSPTITISNVNINKDNGIVYTCRVDNVAGYDEETTTVNVFSEFHGS